MKGESREAKGQKVREAGDSDPPVPPLNMTTNNSMTLYIYIILYRLKNNLYQGLERLTEFNERIINQIIWEKTTAI